MRSTEQVYPIEKSTEPENVWTLSAFQIGWLLRAADQQAMFSAAADYTRTAEDLEKVADGIRRGATDLAATWRGTAAADSQEHLRQYYASARSLASACRSCAAALHHAGGALGIARYQVAIRDDAMPSTDARSMESFEYQQILANLNAAYREATTLAPNQLAISLPDTGDRAYRTKIGDDWENTVDADGGPISYGPTGGDQTQGSRPIKLQPMIPPNPPAPDTRPGNGDDVSKPGASNGPDWPIIDKGHDNGGAQPPGSPYVIGGFLAGGGEGGGIGREIAGAGGGTGNGLGTPIARSGNIDSVGAGPDGRPGQSRQAAAPGGGVFPGQSGQREDEKERERRYYLKEESDVWGSREAVPAVLYGEHRPPVREIDDDDDDDF
jgi:uncharacterized protein YukE